MDESNISQLPRAGLLTEALVAGFGTAVAMWGVGYVGRLPAIVLPSPTLLALLVGCLLVGGLFLGRYAQAGWRAGAAAGLICGLINLLVLGSLLSGDRPNQLVPSALLWIPGSILACAAIAALGAALGRRGFRESLPAQAWISGFSRVAVAATLFLLAVGGLVTSADAGLAVTDWPNSFGYNMFLYPLSRMSGGVYYEHAHRLFGSLVGLTTVVLALLLQRSDERGWLRRIGWGAVVLVSAQGILGGLRVTGSFTLSTSADDMAPNLALAAAHGVLAQIFFSTLVAVAVFSSTSWRRSREMAQRHGVRLDRFLLATLILVLVAQLTLGALQRHFQLLLVIHIVTAVALVAPLAVHVGMRAWVLNPQSPRLQRLGWLMAGGVAAQLLLGILAYVSRDGDLGPLAQLAVATAHQWFGAVLLAVAVALACWTLRLLRPC